MTRILLTGASGGVGTLLRPLLAKEGRVVRLLDIVQPPTLPGAGAEEIVLGSITDPEAMEDACRDVDAIVHLGGASRENTLDAVLDLNMRGIMVVLEAARLAGVPRIVIASSIHSVGFHQREDGRIPADAPPRPDTLYGWSKVAMEAAGRLYHDRYAMDVICLRIGSWFATPLDLGLRGLATWLSPADGGRLVEACLTCENPGFRLVWGVSRNTRRWVSLAEGEEIGYYPVDDAEDYASVLIAKHGEPDFVRDPVLNHLGGSWCTMPLGEPGP
jgi:uronate dehydrogenase